MECDTCCGWTYALSWAPGILSQLSCAASRINQGLCICLSSVCCALSPCQQVILVASESRLVASESGDGSATMILQSFYHDHHDSLNGISLLS